LLRCCGIEPSPSGDGLDIVLKAPPKRFTLDTELLRLERTSDGIVGEYRAVVNGSLNLHVYIPPECEPVSAQLNDEPLHVLRSERGCIDLPLSFQKGDKIGFSAQWRRSRDTQPGGDKSEATR